MQSAKTASIALVVVFLLVSAVNSADKVSLPAALSPSSIDVSVTQGVASSGTLLDGHVFANAGVRAFNMPSVDFSIVRVGVGTVSGTLRLTATDGRALTATRDYIITGASSPAPRAGSLENLYRVIYKKTSWTTATGEDIIVGSSGTSTTFGGNVTVTAEWIDDNGGGGDEVQLEFGFTGTMDFSTTFANGSAAMPSGLIVTLYTDGVPEGFVRPQPAPGYDWENSEGFNNEVSGTVTNNSGQDQRIEVWGDTDGDGVPELIGYVSVSPGATAPIDIGVDMPPGTNVFVRASGVTEGDVTPTITPGNVSLGVDLTFPPQAPRPYEMVVENSTGDNAPVSIGNPDAPQDILVFPPGTSTIGRVYQGTGSGAQQVTGGQTVHTGTSGGTTTQVIAVPGGGGTAQVVGTATVPTATGSQTTQIVQLPSGSQIVTGSGPAPVNPQTPQTGTGSTGTATSSGTGDAAAAQLAAIRAEMSAAARQSEQPGESDPAGDVAGAQENLGEAIEGVRTATDDIQGILGDLNPTLNLPTGIGKKASLSFVMLGHSYEMNFDHPAIVWFRTLILLGISVSWLLFLIRFAKT